MQLTKDDIEYFALLLFETDPELLELLQELGAFAGDRVAVRLRRMCAWNTNERGLRQKNIVRARDILVRHQRHEYMAARARPPHEEKVKRTSRAKRTG